MTLPVQDATHLCCGACGIEFYVPTFWYKARKEKGESEKKFYCPNGHCRVFSESDLDVTRRERDRLAQRLAQRDDELKAKERQLVAQKAIATKLKKRASAGVCPCCNRTFTNMARHMETQHPEFTEFKTGKVIHLKKDAG